MSEGVGSGPTAAFMVEMSQIWDSRYELPLVRQHNNPWIYCAYVFKLVAEKDGTTPARWNGRVIDYVFKCTRDDGTMMRWPDGGGGTFSHDEAIGAAYLNTRAARRILEKLTETDGLYDSPNNELKNMARFPWLISFLKACAGFRVGIWSQLFWSAHVIHHALTYNEKKGDSGTLKIWLMSEMMSTYLFSGLAAIFWKKKMLKKGVTLKGIFSKSYLTEFHVFAMIAGDDL